jgi:hypothetical protein
VNWIQHPSNDYVLQFGDFKPIPATRQLMKADESDPGVPAIVTFWRPSEQEMRMLLAGANVMLYVFGTDHPPVTVEVEVPENKRIILNG